MKETLSISVEIPIAWYDEKIAWAVTWRYVVKKGMEKIRSEEDGK